MQYVICGNYQQFRNYCREEDVNPNGRDVRFLSTTSPHAPISLRGRRFDRAHDIVVHWGTWYEGKYYSGIYEELQRMGWNGKDY